MGAEDNLRWSDENTELLNQVFIDVEVRDITKLSGYPRSNVKTRLKQSHYNGSNSLISFRDCPKKVLDKLRYLRKTQPR